jgi:hypothetical protein
VFDRAPEAVAPPKRSSDAAHHRAEQFLSEGRPSLHCSIMGRWYPPSQLEPECRLCSITIFTECSRSCSGTGRDLRHLRRWGDVRLERPRLLCIGLPRCQKRGGGTSGVCQTIQPPPSRPHMPTRIGIHAGSVGVVGGAGRYASTIVGDVANTASRVEGLNKELGTRLLVSDEVLRSVSGFVLRLLGEFLLARKSEPIRVAEVLGRTGAPVVTVLASNFAMAFKAFQSYCLNDAAVLLKCI